MLKWLSNWWKSRDSYCTKVGSNGLGLFNIYYYPNKNLLRAVAPSFAVDYRSKKYINEVLKGLREELYEPLEGLKK